MVVSNTQRNRPVLLRFFILFFFASLTSVKKQYFKNRCTKKFVAVQIKNWILIAPTTALLRISNVHTHAHMYIQVYDDFCFLTADLNSYKN